MKTFFLTGILIFSQTSLGQANKEPKKPWNRYERLQYIKSALAALSTYSPKTIDRARAYTNFVNKTSCRSTIYELKVQCFLGEIEKRCRKGSKRCLPLYDILTVNKLSENRFITNREKFRLYKKHGTTEGVLEKSLDQRYGKLATQFKLSRHLTCLDQTKPCFVDGLDHFCLEVSDRGQYPWQSCVGALVWFVTQP